jgi:myo-inositol-1-phosphate synthase
MFVVGINGNNGSLLASFLALREKATDPIVGSLLQHGSVMDSNGVTHKVCDLIPPCEKVPFRGWDVKPGAIYQHLKKNQVVNGAYLHKVHKNNDPRLFNEEFVLPGVEYVVGRTTTTTAADKMKDVMRLATDIDQFAYEEKLDHVVVMYAADTEPNIQASHLLQMGTRAELEILLENDKDNVIPASVVYAVACCYATTRTTFVNTAAQNTLLVPGVQEFFTSTDRWALGSDLLTGQTKLKISLMEFCLTSGIEVSGVCSYNVLGNNDGVNVGGEGPGNKSKCTTKASMTDAMLASSPGLEVCETMEHQVTIDYYKPAGDNKRAFDMWDCRVLNGAPLSLHTTMICPDTFLAVPLLIDLYRLVTHVRTELPTLTSTQMTEICSFYFKQPNLEKLRFPFFSSRRNIITGLLLHLRHHHPIHTEFQLVIR